MKTITYDDLINLFYYNDITGYLWWTVKSSGRDLNKPAGYMNGNYRQVCVNGIYYYAHRLIWMYVHGYMPENQIDHINRNGSDNRIKNLREVTPSCNTRNTGMLKNNKSGIKGVVWNRRSKKWVARVEVNCKSLYLGMYDEKLDAAFARWSAEREYGFPNCNTTSSAKAFIDSYEK
jgi:hypothetical protein